MMPNMKNYKIFCYVVFFFHIPNNSCYVYGYLHASYKQTSLFLSRKSDISLYFSYNEPYARTRLF
nr:MAG TPA: hypothetical protein [Caudoviricetes sp.]